MCDASTRRKHLHTSEDQKFLLSEINIAAVEAAAQPADVWGEVEASHGAHVAGFSIIKQCE